MLPNSLSKIIFILATSWVAAGVVNYLADVLPINRRLVRPSCSNCGNSLSIYNYILWPVKCSSCGKWVEIRHWLVRIALITIMVMISVSNANKELNFILALLIVAYFILVSIIDLEHRLIIHPVSLAGAVLGAGIGFYLHGVTSSLLGGLAGFLCMLLLYLFGTLFVTWLARVRKHSSGEDALGFGDVILGGVLGLFLGYPGIFIAIMLAILSAGIVSLVYIFVVVLRKKYHANLTIPYGPFLVLGAFILLFLRNNILIALGW